MGNAHIANNEQPKKTHAQYTEIKKYITCEMEMEMVAIIFIAIIIAIAIAAAAAAATEQEKLF